MIETVSKKVLPNEEQDTIDLMLKFGWQLYSSQEISDTDSHWEKKKDKLYNVTTRENYVKLVFNRDKEMKNYQRIVELEKDYYFLINNKPIEPKMNYILLILGYCLYVYPGIQYKNYFNKKKKEYDEAYPKWENAIEQIDNEIEILIK